ncbi:hypothetical protein JCM10908_000256 [Rhodotorula pacifica]|uniref:uncharacterized protein n=1 Tax=Rhodotorula pacifica TaxID=1495444 RepID=UPI003181ECD1
MPLELLRSAPSVAGPTSASSQLKNSVHYHEQSGVTIQVTPPIEGFSEAAAAGGIWISEDALSFFSEELQQGLSIPYSHISIHAKSKAVNPSAGDNEPRPCLYCQVEATDPDEVEQDDDAAASAESHEVYIWPSEPSSVDKIFSALSHCASLHASYGDQAPAFIAESDYAAADGHQQPSMDLDSQAARFAAMGLDPSSLVYATADGSVAGPGLEGDDDETEEGNGQWDDLEEADGAEDDCAVAEDDELDTMEDAKTMQEVIPGLWIGDYQAAQDHDLLHKRNIVCVVSAMRQEYDAAPGVDMHRVAVDDTDKSNIIEHFVPTAEFISSALARNDGAVLVHCQAGVSRSTTLVAAYLMSRHGLNVEQAIERIRAARPQVDPSEFFMTQLELFERCNCEWDPVRYPEERRFLMSFAQAQIMEGVSPSIVLAYYPSPATTPKDRAGSFGFSMTSLPKSQISPPPSPRHPPSSSALSATPATVISAGSSSSSANNGLSAAPPNLNMSAPPTRKRLTARKTASSENIPGSQQAEKDKPEIAKIGSKAEVVISGRRLLCKICRRELAAKEHIVAHDIGKGQQAFAPNRRDMAAYRAEQDRLRREAGLPDAPTPLKAKPSALPPAVPNPLAALRVAQPLGGGRIVQPRPSNVPRPQPMARPPPRQAASSSSSAAPAAAATDSSTIPPPATSAPGKEAPPEAQDGVAHSDTAGEVAAVARTASSHEPEPPLLPSPACSSYFVEPLSWMSPFLESGVLAGKIVCPNKRCGAKLGNFDWAGNQCSCGAWVCPGFALNVSRVDEVSGV